jgi:predicted nucleotidyltransferase component of viral defense system
MAEKNLEEIISFVAKETRFRPILVEKDYYLTVILNNIGLLLSDKLVFKGGTLLNKVHLNYHRLSEDLDFAYLADEAFSTRKKRSKAIAPIREKMEAFLECLNLKSDQPRGQGFNNSTQYIFNVLYPSFLTPHPGNIKIEISLRQKPVDKPVHNTVNHFYQDPFTGEDLIPRHKILSLSLNEAVAEKLKAAITRKDPAIRDYFDLWHIAKSRFDFHDKRFVSIFKKKLKAEAYRHDFRHNFGLDETVAERLRSQVETDLMPVIRSSEEFDLDKVRLVRNGTPDFSLGEFQPSFR